MLATTWVKISSNTVLSFIDPTTNETKEIPITSLERIVGKDWENSILDKKYRLRDFGGTEPAFQLFFNLDEPLPDSLTQITVKEKVSRGWEWKDIEIRPVNNHYRGDKNIGGKIVIDSLVNQSKKTQIGIYENIEENYSYAFVEHKGKPCLCFYDGNARALLNREGDMIAELISSTNPNVYMGTFYNYATQTSERVIVRFEEGIMTLKRGETSEESFVKIISSSETMSNPSIEDKEHVFSEMKATGSGFIVSGNIVVTNYHVIENANSIKVSLNINGTFEDFQAKVLSTDKTNDIALLTIKDGNFTPLKPAPYNIVSNPVDVGTSIFTIGYPLSSVLGQEAKITDGLISSQTGYDNDAVTYQISVPVQPGNSGGALFDKTGHLVGVVNAGIPGADNVGYAIKSGYLLNLIDSAPIEIELPKGEDLSNKPLPELIKAYKPYVALIKIY